MTGSAMVWFDGSTLRVFRLANAAVVMGRSSDATLQLTDPSVSRQHALLRAEPSAERLENLSQTNPAKVNGRRVDEPVTLSDGDILRLGNVDLAFHRLASAKRVSGPVCSHCSRENPPTQKDCWFCGTSLVNAQSAARSWTAAAFRVASRPPGPATDVYPGESLIFESDGATRIGPAGEKVQGAASVTSSEGNTVIQRHASDALIRVKGRELTDSQRLNTSDLVQVADSLSIVILNDSAT